MQEQEKEAVKLAFQKKQPKKKLIVFLIVLIFSIVIIILSFFLLLYLQTPEHKLSLGANIEEARISQDGKNIYLKLVGGSNDKNITAVKFIFKSAGKEYSYETSEGTKEISEPFKRSFWQWLLRKPKYEGEYDYEIKADEAEIENFNNAWEVSVVFEYETETNQTIITPPLDTTKPTPVQNKTTTLSPGGGGGGGSGTITPCTPESKETTCGSWTCGVKKNNCNEDVNCGDCVSGICENGKCVSNFCAEINDCSGYTDETNCTADVCNAGICKWNVTSESCYNYEGNVYYCDPVNGNTTTGDGSAANPWGTLQSVMEAGKFNGAMIKSGDTVKLRTGFHGHFGSKFGASPFTKINTDYITIEADTSAVPDLNFIGMSGCEHWRFKGLRISPSFSNQVYENRYKNDENQYGILDFYYNCRYITIEDCEIFTVEDISSWTPNDWHDYAYDGLRSGPRDLIVRGNTFKNLRDVIHINRQDTLIEDNIIFGFCFDAIDVYGGPNITIQDNQILDVYDDNDTYTHSDCIQGGVALTDAQATNWIIRRNYANTRTDANRNWNSMEVAVSQGFYIDKMIEGLIENNVVLTDHTWGITLNCYAKNVKIINNTVMRTYGSTYIPPPQIHFFNWNSSVGNPCYGFENVIVRNNIAHGFTESDTNTPLSSNPPNPLKCTNWENITVDHNFGLDNSDVDDKFVDYPHGDVRPLMSSVACNGSINLPGVAVGALPCVCTNNSQCEEVFGSGYSCENEKCVNKTAIKKTNKISQYNITWTFDKEYEYGQFANGDYWVVGPVTIVNITPGKKEILQDGETFIINGNMINPTPAGIEIGQNGYDDRSNTFNSSLSIGNNITLLPNSSLVSSISWRIGEEGCPARFDTNPNSFFYHMPRPALRTQAVLTSLASVPPEGSFRPPYTGIEKPLFNVAQLKENLLLNLSVVSMSNITNVKESVQRPWVDHMTSESGDYIRASENMPNYGRDIANRYNLASLMTMVNISLEDKHELVIYLTQIGIDNYYVIKAGGGWGKSSGAINIGHKFPILFAGVLLNDSNMKGIGTTYPPSSLRFQEDSQTFYITQADVDRFPATTRTNCTITTPNLIIDADGGDWWNDDKGGRQKVTIDGQGFPKLYYVRVYNGTSYQYAAGASVSRVNNETLKVNRNLTSGTGLTAEIQRFPQYRNGYAEWAQLYRWVIISSYMTGYKTVAGPAYHGAALSALMLNAKSLWNNDAFFDYTDYYMEEQTPGTSPRSWSVFTENMWDTYRKNYECVWISNDPFNPYALRHYDCSECLRNCLQSPYCGDGICNGNENSTTCEWDCPCSVEQQRNCEKQLGVCFNSIETCIDNGWPGCDYNLIPFYNDVEICGDSYDNDCDGCIDSVDSDCGGTETNCFDILDNDCDGLLDCQDSDCQVGTELSCNDGTDNDCDSKTDCSDSDCTEDPACQPPEDYISYWKFDGNANDETGVNNGTIYGSPQFVSGVQGQALSFGYGDYVRKTGFPFISPPLTLLAWVKFDEHTTGAYRVVMARGSLFSTNANFDFGIRAYDPDIVSYHRLYYFWRNATTSFGMQTSQLASIANNQWLLITAIINSSYDLELFLNGVSIGSDTGNSAPTDGSQAFMIGSNSDLYYYKGSIDEVMIFNRTLNLTEIQQIYCSQGGEADFCSGTGMGSLSPFTKLWNFFKGLLTAKTGNAITGNAVVEKSNLLSYERISILFFASILVIIILIIIIIFTKNKKLKIKKRGKNARKKIK